MMKTKLFLSILCIMLCLHHNANAQGNRISTNNQIGWYNCFATIKLNQKVGLHTEYQWRRENMITDWQQSLLRVGINYSIKPTILGRVGYALIETYPYGEYPLNGYGKAFTEHRLFEMIQLVQKEGKIDISHRLMLEQRFIGKYASASSTTEDTYPLTNRARYLLRLQTPINVPFLYLDKLYGAVYNEVMINFGKNVNANVFDQNRISCLIGYKFSKTFRLELGYLNQIVQYGRQIGTKNIYQYNNGLILNGFFSFVFS
jgi:Protein of unknown function (DUF2490)